MEAEQNQEDPLDSFEVTKSIYPRMAMCLNSAAISIQDCAECSYLEMWLQVIHVNCNVRDWLAARNSWKQKQQTSPFRLKGFQGQFVPTPAFARTGTGHMYICNYLQLFNLWVKVISSGIRTLLREEQNSVFTARVQAGLNICTKLSKKDAVHIQSCTVRKNFQAHKEQKVERKNL